MLPWRAAPAPCAGPGALPKAPTAAMVAGRLAFGFGVTPAGSPNPPVFTLGAELLLATGVGVALLKSPTFGCGGGVTAFGGAASRCGASGVGIFTISGFGISGFGLGMMIFGACSTFGGGGGGMTLTFGTGGIYGLGCVTGKMSSVV